MLLKRWSRCILFFSDRFVIIWLCIRSLPIDLLWSCLRECSSSLLVIRLLRALGSVERISLLMSFSTLGSSGMFSFWWSYWDEKILAFSLGSVTIWFVSGSSIGVGVDIWCLWATSPSLGKGPSFSWVAFRWEGVDKFIHWYFLCFYYDPFFSFSFSLQACLLVLHITPPLLGSHQFLAFLPLLLLSCILRPTKVESARVWLCQVFLWVLFRLIWLHLGERCDKSGIFLRCFQRSRTRC